VCKANSLPFGWFLNVLHPRKSLAFPLGDFFENFGRCSFNFENFGGYSAYCTAGNDCGAFWTSRLSRKGSNLLPFYRLCAASENVASTARIFLFLSIPSLVLSPNSMPTPNRFNQCSLQKLILEKTLALRIAGRILAAMALHYWRRCRPVTSIVAVIALIPAGEIGEELKESEKLEKS
jgi:hypothetical protein